jgi:site-specific DNA-methyltransferase (adenine-specific)
MIKYINKVIQGDSLEVLKKILSNSIDLIITSPPYFQQRYYGNGENEIGNEKTKQEYLDNLLAIFKECVRVTKDTGTIVFNIGDKYNNGGLSLIPYKFTIQALEKEKVFLVNNITWLKLNPTPRQDKRKLVQATEPFFVFAKTKKYKFNLNDYLQHLDILNIKTNRATNGIGKKYYELIENSDLTEKEKENAKNELTNAIHSVLKGEIISFRMKIRGIHKLAYGGQAGGRNNQINNNGFTIIKITGNKLKRDIIESPVENTKDINHTAVYPLYIIQELIKLLTDFDDIVLDPFNGSGTTCLAAKNLHRKYVGIEINPEYVKLAEQRLKTSKIEQELFV